MPRVAISYRRTDSAMAGRISDQLKAHYGKDNVFIDIENIPYGIDFREHIRVALLQSDILVALIGANWLGSDEDGRVRMQEETDPVRVEIETALERKMRIIPVRIDGAKMPGSSELPTSFGNFAYLNAAEVSSGHFFGVHVEHLIAAIDGFAAPMPKDARAASTSGREGARKGKPQGIVADDRSSPANWRAWAVRYLTVPLIALLVAHYAIVNAFNLNTGYLWLASILVPFASGFALFWIEGAGPRAATILAVALGLAGVMGMTISESLYSGDPMLPQTRFEWLDNLRFAATIALSFVVGHLSARASRGVAARLFE
jgi:hypothetical protein